MITVFFSVKNSMASGTPSRWPLPEFLNPPNGVSNTRKFQQLIQGMVAGQTVDQMARDQLYIHPALPEVLEQALLEL